MRYLRALLVGVRVYYRWNVRGFQALVKLIEGV